MKVLFFRFLALYALFCICSCMDGFFNSSEFDSMDEDFGLEFFESAPIGQSDNFFIKNFADSPLLERTLLQIFNEDPSALVDTDESTASVSRQGTPTISYWNTKWGQMFLQPDVGKPGTKAAKKFERKWRINKPLMEHIIDLCRSVNLWDITHPHLVRVPLEFKVLMAMRVLAREYHH